MKRNYLKILIVLSGFVILAFAPALAQEPDFTSLFSERDLRSTVRFLADDGFEGRGPGSRGGELAAKYIAHRLELAGIKPGNNGSYFQSVSLVGLKPDPNTVLRFTGNKSDQKLQFKFGGDFVGFTDAQKAEVAVGGELVFAGYGIDAPEQNWNDYKGGADRYRGKILLILVNDPPATAEEPDLFGGKALTYYGRWTYKYEEAARRGAAGVILVHTDESAGYGWNVVETSFGGTERFDIARRDGDTTAYLGLKAWMREEAVRKLLKAAGFDFDELSKKARSRNFQPVDLNSRVQVNLKAELSRVNSNNVVGFFEGADEKHKDEYVIYTAHWDHIGLGKPDARGDNIYNGALDNASGVAQVLALAEAFAKLPPPAQPKRSQVFLFTTAEEQGLLGAEYYAANPIFPLEKTAANINIDGGNFYGKTRDYGALGTERSTLGKIVKEVLDHRKMSFSPDQRPEQGYFFRSDHFPFAKKGVPALSIRNGSDYIGREKDWAEKFFAVYNKNHYHQPSDEFRDDWRFDGMVQMLDVTLAIGLRASNTDRLPAYYPEDEFARAQPGRK